MAGPFDTIPIDEDEQFLADMDPYYPSTPDEPEPEPTAEDLAPVELGEQFERDMAAALAMDRSQQGELMMDPLDVGAPPVENLDQFEQDMRITAADPGNSLMVPGVADSNALFGAVPGLDAELGNASWTPGVLSPEEGDLGVDGYDRIDVSPDRQFDDQPLQPEEYAQQPDEIALSDLNDEALLMRQFDDAQLVKAERQRLSDVEMVANENRQAENAEFLRSSQEKHLAQVETILAESREIGQMKVDPERWYSSGGAGRKIGTWVSVLAGGQLGLLSGKGGNSGLDFVMGEINKDIDAQRSNIQNARAGLNQQQGLVGEIYKVTGDMFRAEETARLSALESVDARISSEMAKLDPEGTQAMEKELLLRDVRGRKAKSVAALQEQGRARAIEDAEFEMKVRDQRVGEAETKAKIANMEARTSKLKRPRVRKKVKESQLAGAIRKKRAGQPLTVDEELSLEKYGYDTKKREAELGGGTKGAKADADLALVKANVKLRGQDIERAVDARTVSGLSDVEGNPYMAVTDKEAEELRGDKHALETAVALFDDISILRHAHGVELFGSQEGKAIDAKFATLVLAMKEAKRTGALDDGSVKIITTMLKGSGGDASSTLRDFDRALEGTRLDLVDAFNNKASALARGGYKRYDPERKSIEKSRRKSKEERYSGITQGIPEVWASDPEKREKAVNQSVDDAKWFAKHDSHNLADLTAVGTNLQSRVGRGDITADEAIRIVSPMAKSLANKEWDLIIEASTDELKDKFGTMEKAEYFAGKLNSAREGDEDAIYELFVLRGYAEATKAK